MPSRLCTLLTIFNLIGIWGLVVIPYILALMGLPLPIEAPLHLIDVTLVLVALGCGVGFRSLADMFRSYFGRNKPDA